MVGSLRVIIGCMFSGKTSYIIKEYKRWKSIGKKVICLNNKMDNRFGEDNKNFICSHDLVKENSYECSKLGDIDEAILDDVNVILINEGQFFSDLINFCLKWCEEKGKDIIVSGLDGTFERKPFGQLIDLIPKADSVVKLTALCSLCKDGTEAPFSYRKTNNKDDIVVGGSDMYIPVCRKHYCELVNNNK